MTEHWAEVATAIAGLIGTLGAAAIALWGRRQQARANHAEREITLHREAFDFQRYTQEWGDTYAAILDLQASTCIDRFLLLVAFNGKHDPRWVSDILQIRDANQQPVSYRHLEIDDSYRELLAAVTRSGAHVVKTDDMPPSLLKDIYTVEGVKESLVFHVETRTSAETGAAAVTICSFATHDDGGIDDATEKKCRVMVGRLKGLSANFERKA